MRSRLVFLVLCICSLCGGENFLTAQTKDSSLTVEPIGVQGIEHLLHNRSGKILFLNVWATWCQPCVEEFPDIIRLYGQYHNAGVDFAAISVDYPDEIESKILPFIDSRSVPFKVYVTNIKKDEDFINALDSSWSGAVPATFIIDANGKQKSAMYGQKPFNFFKTKIDSVLGSK